MYRPYIVNNLTNAMEIVKTMADSDHGSVCTKLQFCTVQKSKTECGECNYQRN
jgi:hypothetical protein